MIRLSKHHGLGNDFLIRLDGDVDAAMARNLCDRRRGIGADGLISAVGGRWTLFNADGSRAESSGNGLRCTAQAVARAKGVADLDITFETDAGARRVELHGDVATVEMGAVAVRAARRCRRRRRQREPASRAVGRRSGNDRSPRARIRASRRERRGDRPGPRARLAHLPRARARRGHHRGVRHRFVRGGRRRARVGIRRTDCGGAQPRWRRDRRAQDSIEALLTGETVWIADVEVAWP